jgi:hypothetical protein
MQIKLTEASTGQEHFHARFGQKRNNELEVYGRCTAKLNATDFSEEWYLK